MSTAGVVLLLLASTACFGLGFGLSWVRARRRMRARVVERLREEAHKRMAEEVLRRLRDGELAERVDAAAREEMARQPAPPAEDDERSR